MVEATRVSGNGTQEDSMLQEKERMVAGDYKRKITGHTQRDEGELIDGGTSSSSDLKSRFNVVHYLFS